MKDTKKFTMLENAVVTAHLAEVERNRERLERMRELGVKHTLRKPFEPEALCRLISDVLGLKPSYQ